MTSLSLLCWSAHLCCAVLSRSVMSDCLQPPGLQPTRLLCPCGFSRQENQSGLLCPPPGDLPNPEIEPRSLTLQADSLPAQPQGKPENIGVGSLSLLQWIFLTQESNQGILHCRWILYQLSYQGSPCIGKLITEPPGKSPSVLLFLKELRIQPIASMGHFVFHKSSCGVSHLPSSCSLFLLCDDMLPVLYFPTDQHDWPSIYKRSKKYYILFTSLS